MKKKKILVLNTGGTFNKVYNKFTGKLDIPTNNNIVSEIFKVSHISNVKTDGIIYKDSLDITDKDREYIVQYIKLCGYRNIIIVHGTDTMNLTASYLAKYIKNKKIILTGAMVPFSINPVEAITNLMSAYGFLISCKKDNIYISMHGLIKKYNKIIKNRELGVFQCH